MQFFNTEMSLFLLFTKICQNLKLKLWFVIIWQNSDSIFHPPISTCIIVCAPSNDIMACCTSKLACTQKQPHYRSAQCESGCRLTDMLSCFLSHDRNAREKARIRKEVDTRISAIQHEIQVQSYVYRIENKSLNLNKVLVYCYFVQRISSLE